MRRSPEVPRARPELRRFDPAERAVHWATASLVLLLVVTGIILYVPALSLAVGRRLLIEDLHVFAGVAVFLPLAVGVVGPWGRQLRADLASTGRMRRAEWAWLRSLGDRGRGAIGKFNPGQKLNTVIVGGLLTVLLGTGVALRWGNGLAVTWRTGATFVHDWFALAALVVVTGHMLMALTHPAALRSMVTGRVSAAWRDRHAPEWRPAELTDRAVPRAAAAANPPGSAAPAAVVIQDHHGSVPREERTTR